MEGISVGDIKGIVEKGQAANIKYVRIDNQFRYAVTGGPIEHRQLVKKGEVPVSAGFFSLFKEEFIMSATPSTSLELGPLEEDEKLLKAIFL